MAPTGWGQEGDKDDSLETGCDGHLVEPVNIPDLVMLSAKTRAEP
jgi:hypothetical protein